MSTIQFINGESYESSYGITGHGVFTPILFKKGRVKYFIRNLVKQTSGESSGWLKYQNEKSIDEVEKCKTQLIENGGKYITFHGRFNNPFDFLEWIKEQGYTILIHGELFDTSCDSTEHKGFTDFHGNLAEYSSSFHYRIYNTKFLELLKSTVNQMPQSYAWKREESN